MTKSQKGKKAYVDRKVGGSFQWKTNGECSKGDSCSFSHQSATGNSGGVHRRKRPSSSPAPSSKAKAYEGGEKSSKTSGNRDESSSDKRSKIPCRNRNCNNPSCSYWHPPVRQNYKSETGCIFGNKCFFDMLRQMRSPAKSQRKVVRRISCITGGVYTIGLCIHAPSDSPEAPGTNKNSGQTGSTEELFESVCLMSVVLARPKDAPAE